MRCKVHVQKILKGVISLQCSRQELVQVYAHLNDDLAVNFGQHRKREIPGMPQSFRYRFVIRDAAFKHIFTFNVEDHSDKGYLVLLSFKKSRRPLP